MQHLTQVDILRTLSRHGIPFVVVGGHAVYVHGHHRMTEDVDVIWQRSPESELALQNALTELNAEWISNEIDPTTGIEKTVRVTLAHVRSTHLMMLFTDGGFLDLFDFIPGFPLLDVRLVFDSPVEQEGIRFVSIQWLRKMKEAAGRPKDLEDLRQLERIQPPQG